MWMQQSTHLFCLLPNPVMHVVAANPGFQLSCLRNCRTCEVKSSRVNRVWAAQFHITSGEDNWWGDAYIQNDVAIPGVELAVLGFCKWGQTVPHNAPNVQPSGIRATIFAAMWQKLNGQVQSNISIIPDLFCNSISNHTIFFCTFPLS